MCCIVLQCDLCQKTFARPCLLRSHFRLVHPPDDTVEVYNCTESGCCRTYASVRSLRRHIALIHEGQTAECPYCLRTLSTKVSVTQLHALSMFAAPTVLQDVVADWPHSFLSIITIQDVTSVKLQMNSVVITSFCFTVI